MVESIDPYPGETNVPIVPLYWADRVIAKVLADATSASYARAIANSPVKTVNGESPDPFGNIRINPAHITPAQLSAVLQQTFEGGDNVKVIVDPESGKVRINAHTIGSVWTVNGMCGHVTLTKKDFGLDRVDNTSDAEKPLSNPVRAVLEKMTGDFNARIDSLRTELRTYIDGRITTLQTALNNAVTSLNSIIATKADKNHTHAPTDISGLDAYVRSRVLNRWGNWTPLPLLNGWTGQAYAITDGQMIVFRGNISPGTSTIFGRLPFGFPVPTYAVAYGTHAVSFKVEGGVERRISRMHCENGVMRLDGYISMTNGNQLDGGTLYVL